MSNSFLISWHMYQGGTCIGSNLILFLLSYFLLKMVSVMNETHCHNNNRHRFDKTNWELTKKYDFRKYLLHVSKCSASKKCRLCY